MASLQLLQNIKIMSGEQKLDIKSCVIVGDNLIFVDKRNKRLIKYGSDGSFIDEIEVSSEPYDIDIIDGNIVVVTFGREGYMETIDLQSKVRNSIQLDSNCWGVMCHDDTIYTIVDRQGVVVLNKAGEILRKIPINEDFDQATYIAIHDGDIFFTVFVPPNVVCTDEAGLVRWQCNQSTINQPRGVAVDSKSNTWVACFGSHTISIIQKDSQQSKAVLSETDGIHYPCGMYCDKTTDRLLVTNLNDGNAYLYKIVYD